MKDNVKEQSEEKQKLILKRMREIEKEISIKKEEMQSIKDIKKIDNIELSSMLKLNQAYLVELENEKGGLSYQLITEKGVIGVSNNAGLIELDSNFIEEMNETLEKYGSEYIIPDENKMLNPNTLEDQLLDSMSKNELEKSIGRDMPENEENKSNMQKDRKRDEQHNEEEVEKMEDDLGCDITSCIRIEDASFSAEVLGYQTGHSEKYLAYSSSRNTFILIGKNRNGFEEIQDLCGAQGGGEAARKTYTEYDEQGKARSIEVPEFVMKRNDGQEGALAIDLKYGAICVSSLTPSKTEEDKYRSEEIMLGHSVRPTPDEINLEKQRQEKAKDDDDYDWSTGRPIPRH